MTMNIFQFSVLLYFQLWQIHRWCYRMFSPRFWIPDKPTQSVELCFSIRQHRGAVWVNNSSNMYMSTDLHIQLGALESDGTLVAKQTTPGTCQWTKLRFILVSNQVQNGTLYKGNNNVGRGSISCHVVSIMILLVQYAFSGLEHLLPVAWWHTIQKFFSCSNVLPTVLKGKI